MRKMHYIAILGFLLVSTVQAQDIMCGNGLKSWRKLDFFIPSFANTHFVRPIQFAPRLSSEIIFKSPIHHQAIFCRLEDMSQKKMKVMIQFHVGDYNSRMDMIVPR